MSSVPEMQETPRGVLLKVKVVPGASRSRISGVLGGALKVAVAAPPERGKANAALVEILSQHLGVPARNITVDQGHGSPRKAVLIQGLTAVQLAERLQV